MNTRDMQKEFEKLYDVSYKSTKFSYIMEFLKIPLEVKYVNLEEHHNVADKIFNNLKIMNPKKLLSFRAKITDSQMKIIGECSNIEHLYIEFAKISDESVKYVNKLKYLKMLDLTDCSKITGDFLNQLDLKSLTKLQSITITNVNLKGEFDFTKFKDLNKFILYKCSLTDSFKQKLVEQLPNIKFKFDN